VIRPRTPASVARRRRRLLATLTLGLALVLSAAGCAEQEPEQSAIPATTSAIAGSPQAGAPTAALPDVAARAVGTWQRLPPAPLPNSEVQASVWTGTELMLFGLSPGGRGDPMTYVGAAYKPSAGTWRWLPPIESLNPGRLESGSQAVWTGSEALLVGVVSGAYKPAADRWRRIAKGALLTPAVTVWTGKDVLMWGGGCCANSSADGVAYNAATNTWRRMPKSPLSGRQQTAAAWTGKELVIVGGNDADGNLFADAAAYDPATRTWRKLPPLPAARTDATATWDGKEVVVIGGRIGTAERSIPCDCANAYDPATGGWRQLPAMPYARSGHVTVWTGSQLIVWGGENGRAGKPAAPPNGVAFDPVSNSWTELPKSPLRGRTRALAAWTGTSMLIWGGQTINDAKSLPDGAAYTP
jgi:hypothetical protein